MAKAKSIEKSKTHGVWKKTLLGVFVVLVVVGALNVLQTSSDLTGYPILPSVGATGLRSCFDSDRINFYTPGVVTTVALNRTVTLYRDKCVSGLLFEYYCTTTPSAVRNMTRFCQCNATIGACKR